MKNTEKTMEKIVALCKNRGFVFPGSEIYGGLANTWDYGPLGAELKKNIKNAWWKKFVQENPYNVGLDAAILMNPQTWVASGHHGKELERHIPRQSGGQSREGGRRGCGQHRHVHRGGQKERVRPHDLFPHQRTAGERPRAAPSAGQHGFEVHADLIR